MAEQRDLSSSPLMKTPKSQLTAEPPSIKKDSNLQKKIFYTQRQRRSHYKTVGGVLSQYNQIPYPPGGQPTNWKITISQRVSNRRESSEPHVRLPSVGVWHWQEEPPEHLALKASGA